MALAAAVDESAWDDMLDEFRTLGGTADNVCLRVGPRGRGLFAREPAKPVALRIPENLLVDSEDFIVQDGAIRIRPESAAGARERAFLERYENEFSWGAGGRAETEDFFRKVQALPDPLREFVAEQLGHAYWFDDISSSLLRRRFLENRVFDYHERTVVMPIIELVNHGHESEYEERDGIAISEMFQDEVLVAYPTFDPIQMFLKYGFASPEPVAFSIQLTLAKLHPPLSISREFDNVAGSINEWLSIPEISVVRDRAGLSFLAIGSTQFPRIPRSIFHQVLKHVYLSGTDEVFEVVQHLNRMAFLQLIGMLEGHEGPMIRVLRDVARFQLEAMSHCYGVRKI